VPGTDTGQTVPCRSRAVCKCAVFVPAQRAEPIWTSTSARTIRTGDLASAGWSRVTFPAVILLLLSLSSGYNAGERSSALVKVKILIFSPKAKANVFAFRRYASVNGCIRANCESFSKYH
jgi:hypothetical protein